MYGDALIFVEDLDRRRTDAGFDLFAPEFKGNTVVVAFDLDVVVNVYAGFLPLAENERLRRQRFQGRPFEALQKLGTRGVELPELAVVQTFEQLANRAVDGCQSNKCLVPERRQPGNVI